MGQCGLSRRFVPFCSLWTNTLAVYFCRPGALPVSVLANYLRKRRGLPLFDLPPSQIRRPFAALQMGFIAVVLMPVYFPPVTQVAAWVFMLPFLANFLRDWLAVCGLDWVRASYQPMNSSRIPCIIQIAFPLCNSRYLNPFIAYFAGFFDKSTASEYNLSPDHSSRHSGIDAGCSRKIYIAACCVNGWFWHLGNTLGVAFLDDNFVRSHFSDGRDRTIFIMETGR